MSKELTIHQIPEDGLAKKDAWLAERTALLVEATQVQEVESSEALKPAAKVLKALKDHGKELAKERLEYTRPLDALKKMIMAQEKEMVKAEQDEIDRIQRMCDSWVTREAQRVREENERLLREQAEREMEAQRRADAESRRAELFGQAPAPRVAAAEPAVQAPAFEAAPKVSGSRVVTRYEIRVANEAAVPREFCSPDSKKIHAFVGMCRSQGLEPSMPGVLFVKSQRVEG